MLKAFIAAIGISTCAASIASAQTVSETGPKPATAATFKVVKIRADDALNVRSGPSTQFGVIGIFKPDTRGIAITGECKAMWCPVQHEALSGWAYRGYLGKDEAVVATNSIPPPAASPAPEAPRATPPAPTPAPAPKVVKSLPEAAFTYFIQQGWGEHHAAGIVGNLQAECGPALNCSIGSGGIAQWRAERVTRFRQVFGFPFHKASFNDQLAYIQWELTHPKSPWKDAGRILKNARDAASAASLFDIHYERSSGEARGARIANARTILKRYGGKTQS